MSIVRARDDSCNNAPSHRRVEQGPVVDRPVRNAVLCLVRGMNLRLHFCEAVLEALRAPGLYDRSGSSGAVLPAKCSSLTSRARSVS